MVDFATSRTTVERWLSEQLGDELVESDLAAKDAEMRADPFTFLRATYWRWAEIVPALCPDLMSAPSVLAVGDAHLENFGTWRDADGRLVWGVNDFDEAASMPCLLDLVRVTTSALLAASDGGRHLDAVDMKTIEKAVAFGYRSRLAAPKAIVLERDRAELREALVVSEKQRQKFWDKIAEPATEAAPPRFMAALTAAMPEPDTPFETARRVAGKGSLGRPRWLGVAEWRGGPVVREAKALLTSAWSLARGAPDAPSAAGEIAGGRFRAPDPWYRVNDGIVVRRLSPNNRKLDAAKELDVLLQPDTLELMGQELAALHLGTAPHSVAGDIIADWDGRPAGWLATAARAMANATLADYETHRKS